MEGAKLFWTIAAAIVVGALVIAVAAFVVISYQDGERERECDVSQFDRELTGDSSDCD